MAGIDRTWWVALVLVMVPGTTAQAQICDDFNAGAPCTTRAGFEGLCQPPVVIDSFKRDAYCADKVCNDDLFDCEICGFKSNCADMMYLDGTSDRFCKVYDAGGDRLTPGGPCGSAGTCLTSGVCQESGNATSDPIISGFDGKSFLFDQTGEFTLLSSGDGFRVDVTFTGASIEAKEEASWTSSVRFITSNGDMVTCALPAIMPNTSKMEVTSMPVSSPAQTSPLSGANPAVDMVEMKATAVLGEDGHVGGCEITTSRMHITVYQVSGYKQALLHPEEEWAAPYTWLNTDIKLKKPLPAPVTGVLGATYPVNKDTEAAFLRALEDSPGGLEAAVVGESGLRRLAGAAGPYFLHSSIVGITRAHDR